VVNGFEFEGAAGALWVALLDIEGGGEPEVGLDVGAPTVEVVELLHGEDGAGEVAVESDDVTALGLDPDASGETSEVASWVGGGDVEDGGGDVSEEVVADEEEGVVLAVEVVGVHEHHLGEAGLVEGETKTAGEAGDGVEGVFEGSEAAFFGLEVSLVVLVLVVVDDLAEVDAGEE